MPKIKLNNEKDLEDVKIQCAKYFKHTSKETPEEFPCICVYDLDSVSRSYINFEFVYLKDFGNLTCK